MGGGDAKRLHRMVSPIAGEVKRRQMYTSGLLGELKVVGEMGAPWLSLNSR